MQTNIQVLRQKNKLTQQQLAEKTGFTISSIQKLDAGYNDIMGITLGRAVILAAALNVTVDELINYKQ